jgi:hypothetical protein
MKQPVVIYLTCIAFIIACGQNTSQTKFENKNTSQITKLNVDTNSIAIFSIKSDLWLRKRFDTNKSFYLTNTDLKTIDELFNKCVFENNIDTAYFHYKRQYVPFIDKDGHKKVWINCFCSDIKDDFFADWKTSIVRVDDGGRCFFHVTIDLIYNSFSDFEVNGDG